jgi:multidrug transporter EmrE-like cation transporter
MTTDVFILVLIAMVFYGFGEYFSKMFANTSLPRFVFLSLISYLFTAACWLPAIKKFNSLSVLGTIWNVSYVIITLSIGRFVFHEPLTILQIIGIILGFIAIVLLSI